MRLSIGIIAGTLAIAAMDYARAECATDPYAHDALISAPNQSSLCRLRVTERFGHVVGDMWCPDTGDVGSVKGVHDEATCTLEAMITMPSYNAVEDDGTELQPYTYSLKYLGIQEGVGSMLEACKLPIAQDAYTISGPHADEIVNIRTHVNPANANQWQCRYDVIDHAGQTQERTHPGWSNRTCPTGGCQENPRIQEPWSVEGTWDWDGVQWSEVGTSTVTRSSIPNHGTAILTADDVH